MFNVVKATHEDGSVGIATAINWKEKEKLTLERLEQILELQRLTLLEHGGERNKDEAFKIGAILVAYQDNEIKFEVAKEKITREEYMKLCKRVDVEEQLTKFEWEEI